MTGVEPVTSSLPMKCSTTELHGLPVALYYIHHRIQPGQDGAGDEVRTRDPQLGRLMLYQLSYTRLWWWGKDLNLRRRRRQIYSLLPLTTREPHHRIHLNHRLSAAITSPNSNKNGAGDGTRTRSLLITNQLLYQLSYTSLANNPSPTASTTCPTFCPSRCFHRDI